MEVSYTNSTQYIRVRPCKGEDVTLLINAKKDKNHLGWYTVERCLVNDIILGLDRKGSEDPVLKFDEGLKPYQVKDVIKMITRPKVCNFNRMGYGKTVEAARAMRELGIRNAVIVAPKSVLLQWQKQLEVWYPEMKGHIEIYNSKTVIREDKIVIINYEKLISDKTLQKFKEFRWDLIVADEAHRIKNRGAKRTKAIKSIPATFSWAMTGTPITKKPDDLWSILNFLGQYYSGKSYWNFVDYFCKVREGFFGLEIEGLTEDSRKINVLHRLLDKIAVINGDLGVTPGKQINNVVLKMTKSQNKLYRDAKNLILEELPDTMTIPNGAVLVTRLMQITSAPQLYECNEPGIKFEYIKDLMLDNPETKFVVFSKFANTCELLKKYLSKNSIRTAMYIGSMSTVDRFENKQDFIQNPNCRAIIGTIGAMGEGVDGLQDVCRDVVFIDRDFSPEIVAQAEDRVNRMGQKHTVYVQYLQCDKTYDKHVDKVNLKRTEDIRRALMEE